MESSDVTVTDMFCGCGGSSQGAANAGANIRMAANHWALAIETHNTNFPKTDHDCADINQVEPRRWPRTTALWASPECTNHSQAKGKKRWNGQLDLFEEYVPDEEAERSRATMWDVPRFAEFHSYRLIIVENVVEARKWRLFPAWLHAMECLDYEHHVCYFNSMFFGVPQSRDRMYAVFWKKGQHRPNLEFRPKAHCPTCDKEVEAVQTWKNPGYHWGRYGANRQYIYCCPACSMAVNPYYTPAFVAIDWSDVGQRIGDRARPLRPKTMARIEEGLRLYGNQFLVLEVGYSHASDSRVRPASEPLQTLTTRQTVGISVPSALVEMRRDYDLQNAGVPLPTIVASGGTTGMALPPASIAVLRRLGGAKSPDEPLTTITASGGHHGLLRMPYLAVHYTPGQVKPVSDVLGPITTVDHHSVVIPEPFLASYYGRFAVSPVGNAMGTITPVNRHSLITITVPGELPKLEDCYFRMFQPEEHKLGMAFHPDYVVLGNKRQQTRQCGGAVTPPVAEFLFQRGMEVL